MSNILKVIKEAVENGLFTVDNKPLKFEEAIEYFKNKVPVTSSEFYSVSDEYKTKAFTVSGYTSANIINQFQQELTKALEEGFTKDQFRKQMNSFLEQKGYEGMTPFQSDNIFRTNLQTAFNVGHYKQMTKPSVLKARPYWMYDAVNDKRTRPSHMAMHRKVYPADHEVWNTWYPPNGYRCRCGVRSLSERQVKAMGLEVEKDVPKMLESKRWDEGKGEWIKGQLIPTKPDVGFRTNPATNAWQPDTSKYPEVLKKAFENRQKER